MIVGRISKEVITTLRIRNMSDKIKFIQANIQHSRAASATLSRIFAKDNTDVALIQEPWISSDGKISGLTETGGKILFDNNNIRPRTCIVFGKHVDFLPVTDFCSQDLVAAQIQIPTDKGSQNIIVCSAYFPGDEDQPPPEEVRKLVSYCKRRNMHLIIGCDANAHNLLWGSTNTNERGECLLDFITSNSLEILNVGNEPTFVNVIRQEVLDITLCTPYIGTKVTGWHVSSEPSCSDHRHIKFEVESDKRQIRQNRVPQNTNWENYKEIVKDKLIGIPDQIKSIDELELAVDSLQQVLIESYETSCPVETRSNTRKVPWWNHNLSKLRQQTRRLFNQAKVTGEWENYRKALTEYNREIRRSKRNSWRKFCQNISDIPTGSRIHKILSKGAPPKLGLLKDSNGATTETGKDTLKLLLQTHFPGSKIVEETAARDNITTRTHTRPNRERWLLANKIFKPEVVKWAISTFKPFKSPGEDGVYPALLQQGVDNLLPILTKIFRASLAWGHVPSAWTMVKVTYIPKAGRQPDNLPKSFRPISLTSFLLKTMEKVIDRYIRDTALRNRPLHPDQHAYQSGKSTETALDNLVRKIEHTLNNKEVALVAFLDIEGAFNNASFESTRRAAARKGIEPAICNWIQSMLSSRKIKSTLAQEAVTAVVTRGCPQGGVLSPLIWSIIIDDLLRKLANAGYEIQGYADDLVIIVRGKFVGTLAELLQNALNMVQRWCEREQLCVNPSKTTIVPFTNKRKLENFRNPTIYGETIPFSKEAKYLGVILDSKLNWNSQLQKITHRARMSLWTCRRLCGKTWGLNPKMTYWLYLTVIRPMISYAALVWWAKTINITAKKELDKLQRQACLGITGAMSSTPTAAIEVLLNLPPLHLFIEAEAKAGVYRIAMSEEKPNITYKGGHSKAFVTIENDPTLGMPSDKMTPRYNFERPFKITIPKLEDWENNNQIPVDGSLIWYTDGSKTEKGVGVGIYSERPRTQVSCSLGQHATIFQAEMHAIEICIERNLREACRNKSICIFSDSQAALKALNAYKITSKLVWNCLQNLKILGQNNRVNLIWIPGHKGFEGNEAADLLAKEGAESVLIGPEPFCGISKCSAKRVINLWIENQKKSYWDTIPGQRHSKSLMPMHSKERSIEAICMGRNQLRKIIGLLTGHCRLKKHLHRMGLSQDSSCRFCDDEEETAEHILCVCDALAQRRLRQFGQYQMDGADIWKQPLGNITNFIRSIGLSSEL